MRAAVRILGSVLEPPESFHGPDGSPLVRIDDPLVDRITKGDPTFGWEGDDRYRLYVNYQLGRWELWRHEDDGVMRFNVAIPGFIRGNDAVAWVVKWIVDHDSHRGFDALQVVEAANTRWERERAAAAAAHTEEFADRLHHALLRDVGPLEVGLSRRQF